MARFVPSLDAYLDPTVTIARVVGPFGPRIDRRRRWLTRTRARLLELAAGLGFWPALTDPEHIARLGEQTQLAIPAGPKRS